MLLNYATTGQWKISHLHMLVGKTLWLNRGSKKAQDARLGIHARGFWERHRSAFFDVRVCHPYAASYRNLEPQQIYRIYENEKKRLYSRRVLDIEHGTFTPLAFTTTGGMGKECLMYHSRLAQLIAIKKGEQYAKTILWIRTRTSFALEICVDLS